MENSESRNSSERPSKRTPQHDSTVDESLQPSLKNIPLDLINAVSFKCLQISNMKIFLLLDLRSTCALCLTCKQFQQFITSNNEIWKSLYISKQFLTNDFKPPQFSWREWLQRSSTLFVSFITHFANSGCSALFVGIQQSWPTVRISNNTF